MKLTRRKFLAAGATASAALVTTVKSEAADAANIPHPSGADSPSATDEALEKAAAQPVLVLKGLRDPVIIESIQLLKQGRDYFLRVRSKDGAEGIAVDDGRARVLYPVLLQLVVPYFLGKDARELEEHLFGVYRYKSNYKLQGMALWCSVALVEMAILDLLGRLSGKSIGELLGGVVRDRVPFYVASERRDTTPEQEIDYLRSLIDASGAKAVKYRVGGRMSRNQDAMPGRTDKLIPLSRKALGDAIAIHADSNSSYDPPQAIRVGRMLEEIKAVFYEEPCPFDNLEAIRKVADALTIPVALGEQESSQWRFQYTIRERVADVIQPDLFYYGGLIRSIRVARMAALRNMPATPHISGGFGFVYMLHFVSCIPNIATWQEYKEGVKLYGDWFNPRLRALDGALNVPKGPGVGITDPAELLKGAEVVKA
jgi:L-alanine-DL-glutamate epimerase-like enolase superfamily enzyme